PSLRRSSRDARASEGGKGPPYVGFEARPGHHVKRIAARALASRNDPPPRSAPRSRRTRRRYARRESILARTAAALPSARETGCRSYKERPPRRTRSPFSGAPAAPPERVRS